MLFASDSFLGISTLALAVATFILAGISVKQLKESRAERQVASRSLDVAEASFRTEQHPELIASDRGGEKREVQLAAHGAIWKWPGTVWVGTELIDSQVGLVSFDVLNIGRGAAEISVVRLMSLDTVPEGGDPAYWEPDISARRSIMVGAGGIAPVDLVLAPQPPSWFYGHMQSWHKFWAEVVYSDLGGIEEHVRWFEFWRQPGVEPSWFVGQVLRSTPSQFTNLPPGNPLVEPEIG